MDICQYQEIACNTAHKEDRRQAINSTLKQASIIPTTKYQYHQYHPQAMVHTGGPGPPSWTFNVRIHTSPDISRTIPHDSSMIAFHYFVPIFINVFIAV
ncbi:unnamed protein product [Euphydryas editha]|uniref:Uncharacterized protein n=1 Tax=Euphydryas editha TaxID=104508 RepID=A0AAU9T9Y0_EUPED|nr:unnamed protein product [Euphydryas editha]